ncbi:bla regulator protein BlaR1 [Kroppenstedtia sanguinis]
MVIGWIISSLTIAVILLIKKVFQKQLSAKWQYHLWFFLLIALSLPLLPSHLLNFGNHLPFFERNQGNPWELPANTTGDHGGQKDWSQDFTISVNPLLPDFLHIVIAGIWMAGIVVVSVLTVKACLKIRKIRKSTSKIKNEEVLLLFEQCKLDLNLSRNIYVGKSPLVKSAMTFGLFKTYVVLPTHFEDWLSMKELKYIFLHELHHYKNKDILTNDLLAIFQILYWFNPLVWIAFREMRLDREIACDHAVLNTLVPQDYVEYGNTMIHVADKVSQPENFVLANQLNGSKKQLKKRIEKIANFTAESKLLKRKSFAIFMLVGIFVASQIPFISAMAKDHTRYDFKNERTVHEDLSKYFTGLDGGFVLYDMQADRYHIYNENHSTLRVSPDSTYKIFSALYALESKIITQENSTLKWNGKTYPYQAWNQDQDLYTAMSNSVNWYFEDLDKKSQRKDLQAFLKQIRYGNTDFSGGNGQYWLESSSLKISPVEQVQLLQAFYTNQFGFSEKNIQTVKDTIRLEEKAGKQLSGKTGTGAVNHKNINGWFIGYVETGENTYFFATNIRDDDHAQGSRAAKITLSILKGKGIY